MKLLIVIGMLLSLSACVSSPKPVHYFQFSDQPVTAQLTQKSSQQLLLLAPINLRGDLNNRGIVSQVGAQEIVSANFNLWGESPSVMLTSTAQQQLQNTFADHMVVKSIMGVPQANIAQVYELQIELDKFNAGINNDGVIQGSWRLIKRGERSPDSLVKIGYFNIETPLDGSGFEVLVGSLQQAWQQSIEQVADSVKPIVQSR